METRSEKKVPTVARRNELELIDENWHLGLNNPYMMQQRFYPLWLLILMLFLLPSLFAQPKEWEVIQLDDVSFSLLSPYKKSDTLGQLNFLSTGNFGYIQVVKIPQPQAMITNVNELIEYYKAFQSITIDQSYGDLISDSTMKLNGLYLRTFIFENYWNDSLEIQENLILLVDRSMYSFTYAYLKEKQATIHREKERFFSGITIYSVDFEDQLTIPNKNEQYGMFVGKIFQYIILAAIVLVIILWFLKKFKLVRLIKRIFSMIFLSWGGVCVFLYVGNLFFDQNPYSLLIMGIISLIVGYVLHVIKVPTA